MVYLIGLFGGIIGGLFGAGSGLIILPALKKFEKVDEYKARGTTLSTVLIIIIATSIFYYNYNYFDMEIGIYTAIGGIIGGIIGAKIMKKIPKFYLAIAFDIFLIWAALRMIIQG